MDRETRNRKIVDLSEEELTTLGFLGPNALERVSSVVQSVRADPMRLGEVNCFQVELLRRKYAPQTPGLGGPQSLPKSPTSPASSVLRDSDNRSPRSSDNSSFMAIVAPDLMSQFEIHHWYHGLSESPPKLMWRSDFETNPFRTRQPGERFFSIRPKTAYGVFNTRLNEVWNCTVAPRILDLFKARGLKYAALKTARFLTVDDEDGTEIWSPITVWIAVHPNTTNAAAVRDVTPEVLQILNDAQVYDAVVECPTFGLNHPFNTGLGIPIARASDNAQGTVTLLFREVKTKDGKTSDRVLALTNKHVATLDTTTPYDFNSNNRLSILVCGERRFNRAFNEVEDTLNNGLLDAVRLAGALKNIVANAGGQKTRAEHRRHRQNALDRLHEDNETLLEFFDELDKAWRDVDNREFAKVDWAPSISVAVGDRPYTQDLAVLAVDEEKLKNFTGNFVDLGNQYGAIQLEDKFWPVDTIRGDNTIPYDRQLPIRAAVSRHRLMDPFTEDKNGEPLYVVGKYGNTTKLTLGNYSGLDAYVCTESGIESRECVVYNGKGVGHFSDEGDSGSLVFNGSGDGLAMLHSGMTHRHVSYGTPLWWVMEVLLEEYPHAEFYGTKYTHD